MNWESIIWKVVSVYGHWLLVAGAFVIPRSLTTYWQRDTERPANTREKVSAYVVLIGVCLFFSFMTASNLGTHQEGGDGYMDSGETVIDFEPTNHQRWTKGIETLLLLLPAGFYGVYSAFEKDKKRTPEERKNLRNNRDTGH